MKAEQPASSFPDISRAGSAETTSGWRREDPVHQRDALLARTCEAKDKGDKSGAVTLLKQALASFPGLSTCTRRRNSLASSAL